MIGGDFTQLLKGLVENAPHLRLPVFELEGWLRPDSLLEFLSNHPTIKELIGVDFFSWRMPVLPPHFLPALQVLVCHIPITAELLCSARPIPIEIKRPPAPRYSIDPSLEALQQCPGTIVEVNID